MHDAARSFWWKGAAHFVALCLIGLLVGLATAWIHARPTARSLDRSFVDLMMRLGASGAFDLVGGRNATNAPGQPSIFFVDIGDPTCVAWSNPDGGGCSERYRIQRDKLADLLVQIAEADRSESGGQPKMIVIDINMSPNETAEGREHDRRLCEAILAVAKRTAVIVPQPITRSGGRAYFAASILRKGFGERPACSSKASLADGDAKIWFASPQFPAGDPVIRGVYRWHDLYPGKAGDLSTTPQRIAGLAYLAAQLAGSRASVEKIAAEFPASAGVVSSSNTIRSTPDAGINDNKICNSQQNEACDHILFRFALDKEDSHDYDTNMNVFETREASDLSASLQSAAAAGKSYKRLSDRIVVIGGSFETNRDLHATPLGNREPGAVVHAAAINAYSTDAIVNESESWMGYWLVVLAAVLGTIFHLLGDRVHSRYEGSAGRYLRLGVEMLGVVLSSAIIISVAFIWGFRALATGIVSIAVLTPALAVAFEGACAILHEFSSLVIGACNRIFGWATAASISAGNAGAGSACGSDDDV